MSEALRLASAKRVRCRCPDGRAGLGIQDVRAVAMPYDDGVWHVWASHHGPGTDCGGEGPPTWSYKQAVCATREEAVRWLHEVTGWVDATTDSGGE